MKEWFARYNPREQMSLLIMAFAVSAYIIYFFTWAPIAAKRDEMALRNVAAQASLRNVDAMVTEIEQLRKSGQGSQRKQNLTSVINRSTGRLNLPVSRLQPNSRGEIQVRLENAAFDDVLAWLHEMEYTNSLIVREVSITEAGTVGRINASVRVAQGG